MIRYQVKAFNWNMKDTINQYIYHQKECHFTTDFWIHAYDYPKHQGHHRDFLAYLNKFMRDEDYTYILGAWHLECGIPAKLLQDKYNLLPSPG